MKKVNVVASIVMPTVVLAAICIIVTFLLSVTNAVTADKIEQNNKETLAQSQKIVLENCESFDEIEADTVYLGKDKDGNQGGYVIVTSAAGYGGPVKVMTGIDMDGKVTGIIILEHDETPGLGAKATGDSFREQYVGISAEGSVNVTKDGGDIDAISGATITSRAVCSAVNQAIDIYNTVKEGN